MKKYAIGVLVTLFLFPTLPALSAPGEEELTPAQQEAVKKAVDEYLNRPRETPPTFVAPPAPPAAPSAKTLQQLGTIDSKRQKYGSTMQGSGALIYAKPFVSSPKAIVGGYMDIEYTNRDNQG
ncbi:MAG: hypothetical protein CO149_06445, partial [Nitrospirae bacterium CG_4_9_14_3_um_filter_51_5]